MNPCLQDRAFELLVVFMISTSVLGLTTALMGWFRPEGVFAFGLVSTFIYQQGLRYFGVSIQKKRIGLGWLYILAILLMGAFFRIPPYHCILGGQDQGVYVNIASSIERTGTVTAVDPVLDRMAGPHHERYVQDNYGSSQYLPGVFRTREASGNVGVEFQFYHLFPVWMAIFEGIFGSESGVYALTFMSMVSLLLCYWLVRILTESDAVAFAAALLLTLNPLHAFFSKFPVTEAPTLAFSLAGFSCFAAYWVSADRQGAGNGRFLVLSALSFGCLFTTRISGFFYMPTLFVLFAAVLLREESRNIRNAVAFWAFLVFLLYGISVWYGLTWSANYSHWIYSHSFSKVFGKGWPIGVSVVAVAMSVAFVCILVATKIERLRKFLASILAWLSGKLGLMFALIMIAGGYKLYQFAFTDTYAGNPWLGERWELAGRGLGSVAVSSLAATTLYVSPMIVMVFVYFMLLKFKDGPIHLTKFFLLSLFTYIALLNFVIPYHPYYARYLLSELVPYMIVFVVWGWSLTAHGSKRNIVAMLLVAAALYSGTLSFLQVGNAEQRGAYEGLSRIASQVGENDLILLHGKDLYGEIKTPLVYTFGKNVISISDDSMLDRAYMSFLLDSFEDVYLGRSFMVKATGIMGKVYLTLK
ncbi:MAG: phospholipid carrier-dependent glycosyltransferase [Dissulfuribacterales bacterium]